MKKNIKDLKQQLTVLQLREIKKIIKQKKDEADEQ